MRSQFPAADDVFERLRAVRIVPVIVIDDPDDAVPLARALADGGLSCAEITFRTARAAEALRRITDEAPDLLEDFDAEGFLNARLKVEVLAGAHLAARKAMAQSLPWMIQIFENPHILQSLNAMGYTLDVKELFDMVAEVSEWRNQRQLIRKMTPKEKAAYEQSANGPGAKTQADLMKIKAQGEVDAQLNDQKAEARLASKLTEQAMDRAGGREEMLIDRRALQGGLSGEGDSAEA